MVFVGPWRTRPQRDHLIFARRKMKEMSQSRAMARPGAVRRRPGSVRSGRQSGSNQPSTRSLTKAVAGLSVNPPCQECTRRSLDLCCGRIAYMLGISSLFYGIPCSTTIVLTPISWCCKRWGCCRSRQCCRRSGQTNQHDCQSSRGIHERYMSRPSRCLKCFRQP